MCREGGGGGGTPARRLTATTLHQVAFQATIIASGNLSFLNHLTIAPCIFCFDDRSLEWMFTEATRQRVKQLQRDPASQGSMCPPRARNSAADEAVAPPLDAVGAALTGTKEPDAAKGFTVDATARRANALSLRRRAVPGTSTHKDPGAGCKGAESASAGNKAHQSRSATVAGVACWPRWTAACRLVASAALACLIVTRSTPVLLNMLSSRQVRAGRCALGAAWA